MNYLFFWGHTQKPKQAISSYCLSQWYESPFTVKGITYNTTEHWMMAHKAKLFGNTDIFEEIVATPMATDVKKLGRKVTGFNDQIWKENRYDIVHEGNLHKFSQIP